MALGDLLVLAGEAVGEAEIDLGVGVFICGAELYHVAQALGLAVLALDAVVVVGGLADVRELELDAVRDLDHGGQDEQLQAVEGVGAFGPGSGKRRQSLA